MKQIECDEGLWQQLVPKMEWDVWISGAEACNEVIFEGANHTFSGVAAVDAGRNELVVYRFAGHVGLEYAGSFVVELL